MRIGPLVLAAAAAALTSNLVAPKVARADTLTSARFDMVETSHRARIVVDRGSARMVVQRTVRHNGDRSDEATWHIDVPEGAVAVGLRTAGVTASGAPVWFTGELMEAEAAAAKYKELTGIGGYYPKDPALLSWRSADHLALQVFPVLAKTEKAIEYTFLVPTRYRGGHHTIELRAANGGLSVPRVSVVPARVGDQLLLNGVPVSSESTVTLDQNLTITLKPAVSSPVSGSLASLLVDKDKAMTHARLFMAPRLSRVPDNAAIAIVIDASRSMNEHLPNALAAARSYLSHFRGASSVDVFTFDRQVHRLSVRAMTPNEADGALAKAPVESANGSRLDDALVAADTLLASRPNTERRLLLISDFEGRSALQPHRFGLRKWQSGAVVHLATIADGGAVSLRRTDESPWAFIASNTGGVFWEAVHPQFVDATSRAVMEEWARPVRLDAVEFDGVTLEDPPETLAEGTEFESWSFEPGAVASLGMKGLLWSRPFAMRFSSTSADVKRASALVFGAPFLSALAEREMTVLAFTGGAVSPVTSYLAIEPGVRPSTEGLEYGGLGLGGVGGGAGLALGRGVSSGHTAFDAAAYWKRVIGPIAKGCGAGAPVQVELETTRIEIVDITRVAVSPRRDVTAETCIEAALWNLTLPNEFDRIERLAHSITVSP